MIKSEVRDGLTYEIRSGKDAKGWLGMSNIIDELIGEESDIERCDMCHKDSVGAVVFHLTATPLVLCLPCLDAVYKEATGPVK